MNNKNKAYLTILFAVLFSLNTTQAAQSLWDNLMWGFWSSMNFWVPPSVWVDTSSQVNTEEDTSEDTNTDDEIGTNSVVSKDLKFTKDGEIWVNAEIVWNVYADKNLKILTNTIIQGNVIVKWNLELSSNVEITWYVKVNGDLTILTNSKINWTIYGYKKINAWVNVETNGKLKSASTFITGTNYEWIWKLYTFANKKMWVNSEFQDNKEKWILGKLDAYLKIDISDDEFTEVKKIAWIYDWEFAKILAEIKKLKISLSVVNSKLKLAKKDSEKETLAWEISALNEKISALKIEWKDLVEKLVVETEQYIENEEFDIKWVSTYTKNEELAKLELSQTVAKEIVNKVVDKVENKIENKTEEKVIDKVETKNNLMSNNSAKDEKMKIVMRWLLEKKLAKFDDAKKNKMYDVLVGKLATMIEKSNNEKMKNTLTLLKEVVVEMQDEWSLWDSIDNLFNGATDEAVQPDSGTWSEVKTNLMN